MQRVGNKLLRIITQLLVDDMAAVDITALYLPGSKPELRRARVQRAAGLSDYARLEEQFTDKDITVVIPSLRLGGDDQPASLMANSVNLSDFEPYHAALSTRHLVECADQGFMSTRRSRRSARRTVSTARCRL